MVANCVCLAGDGVTWDGNRQPNSSSVLQNRSVWGCECKRWPPLLMRLMIRLFSDGNSFLLTVWFDKTALWWQSLHTTTCTSKIIKRGWNVCNNPHFTAGSQRCCIFCLTSANPKMGGALNSFFYFFFPCKTKNRKHLWIICAKKKSPFRKRTCRHTDV